MSVYERVHRTRCCDLDRFACCRRDGIRVVNPCAAGSKHIKAIYLERMTVFLVDSQSGVG